MADNVGEYEAKGKAQKTAAEEIDELLGSDALTNEMRASAVVAKAVEAGLTPVKMNGVINKLTQKTGIGKGVLKETIKSASRGLDDWGLGIAHKTLEQHYADGDHLVRAMDGSFWTYTGTHWRRVRDDLVRKNILKVVKAETPPHSYASVVEAALKLLAAEKAEETDVLRLLDEPPPIINCRNGELVVNEAEVVQAKEDIILLSTQVAIEVHTASFRSVRGYTVVAALCDEIAFWRAEESANPDREVLNALRPAMATVPGAMLLAASSPYAQRGVLYDTFRRHHGRDDAPVLVWRADTRTMNPSVPQTLVDEAYEQDPDAAAAEYGAEFRRDVEDFLSRGAVEDCVEVGVRERRREPGRSYVAFADPSGGSRDSFTLAVAHREGDGVVLDALRERRPPFSPEAVVGEYADLLRSYGLSKVRGDRYAGEWPREAFRRCGVEYEPSAKPKSDIYVDVLPLINARRARLLDDRRLVHQLASLERRTSRGGRDSVDHPPGGHDDLANAAAGALVMLDRPRGQFRTFRLPGF